MTSFQIPPPAFLDDPALQSILAALPGARLVGGAVRDAVAERPVADIDLATPLPPQRVAEVLAQAGLKHAPTGLQHGTITAISHKRGFEITTLRRDEATDGRHAQVAWTTDWEQDAARRDFTFNAMSMSPDGTVFDYFDGRADLLAGRTRFVGDPAQRIAEDYLRVLRYFRFHGRYGATPPDAATAAALREGATHLHHLSVERVWSELKRILSISDPLSTIRLMAELGVLEAALPGGADIEALARLVASGAPPDPLLRLAALQPGTLAADRLKLSRAETAVLESLDGSPPDPEWDDDALRRALAETPAEALIGRAWLAGTPALLRTRIAAESPPVFPLGGRDVVALGIEAGPRVGTLLAAVRAWWMAGGCRASRAECRAELARLAAA